MRRIRAFLDAIPIASLYAMREDSGRSGAWMERSASSRISWIRSRSSSRPTRRALDDHPQTVFPSLSSQGSDVEMNADGSYTVWFGPEAPGGKERNWIQTVSGKGWFVILRLSGPLESWFDKTWRPGEIQR